MTHTKIGTLLAALLTVGCSYTRVGQFESWRLLSDSTLSKGRMETPDGTKVEIEGYSAQQEAVKQLGEVAKRIP